MRRAAIEKLKAPALDAALLALCCLPLGWSAWQLLTDQLGPDPAKMLMQSTGGWGLRGLTIVLLAAPLSRWGYRFILRYRRMLGVVTFSYASVHLLLFAQVYVGWSSVLLVEELRERPYVLVGFAAWLCLLLLAVTSTDRARRSMGKSWRSLHKLIYPATVLAWLHLLWLARSDVGEVVVYGLVFGLLLGWRMVRRRRLAA